MKKVNIFGKMALNLLIYGLCFCTSLFSLKADSREPVESVDSQKTGVVSLQLQKNSICLFENKTFKGQIADNRFVGLKVLKHKASGIKISGHGPANKHGLMSLYRIFTKNKRYGSAAWSWKERKMTIEEDSLLMAWPETKERPFVLQARYSFPEETDIHLEVTVEAKEELEDFEVMVASYFDTTFPKAEVLSKKGKLLNSPKELGVWHAFPLNKNTSRLMKDGRWQKGPNPVNYVMREELDTPVSIRRHKQGLTAVLQTSKDDSFAIYTAHDNEWHYSNYHALFGRTIKKGEKAKAKLVLKVEVLAEKEFQVWLKNLKK